MRTATTTNNVKVVYPDEIVWMGDNNWCDLTNTLNDPVGALLVITINGNSYNKEYNSQLNYERFSFDDVLRISTPGTVTVKIQVTANGTVDFVSFTFQLYYGRTLTSRHHGSVTDVLLPIGVTSVDIFTPLEGGTMYIGGVGSVFTGPKIDTFAITSCGQYVNFFDNRLTQVPKWFGDLWNEEKKPWHTIKTHCVCPSDNGIVVKYYDTDGCLRYAVGEVIKVKDAAKNTEVRRRDSVIADIGKRIVSEFATEITIGIADVPKGAYLEDIICSHVCTIDRGGVSVEVIPVTLSVEREMEETKDYQLTFKVQC